MPRPLPCLATVALLLAAPAIAEDAPVTARERAGVIAALEARGCAAPRRIEREDHGYEADDVRCRGRDGLWEAELAHDFRIIDLEPESSALTTAQRNRVNAALARAGCRAPASIEREDDGYEVEGARCREGKRDLVLDANYRIAPAED